MRPTETATLVDFEGIYADAIARTASYIRRYPDSMLQNAKIMPFVAIQNEHKALAFYGDLFGLRTISSDQFAIEFDAGNGIILRAAFAKEVTPAPYTVLGWQVTQIENIVREMIDKGVVFERYGFMQQDDLGIWNAGSAKVAWFKDPFGNLLSVSEHGL